MIGKKSEKNNLTITLNVLYAKNEKIYPAYLSKGNSNLKPLIEKTDGCKNSPEKLFTTKLSKHIPSGFCNVYNIMI